MKRRYYFDTSVFGGVFDEEFSEHSIQLLQQVKRGRVICLYSKTVEEELLKAPPAVISVFKDYLKEHSEYLDFRPEADALANAYINEKIVGKSSLEDCHHIALATLYKADMLISWNFKHIVNSNRINGYNSVNLKMGYSPIRIMSPKDLLHGKIRKD